MSSNGHPTALQQAGIDNGRFSSDRIELEEVPAAVILRLHSLEDPDSLAVAVGAGVLELPLQVNHSIGADPAALCLRPGEWLIFSESAADGTLAERIEAAVDPGRTALIDLSDGLATFRLSGAAARWLLSKLSGLDYLAGRSAGQHCARTLMGRAAVVVHYHRTGSESGAYVFDLIFDRSIAKYLWELLTASAPHAFELSLAHDGV